MRLWDLSRSFYPVLSHREEFRMMWKYVGWSELYRRDAVILHEFIHDWIPFYVMSYDTHSSMSPDLRFENVSLLRMCEFFLYDSVHKWIRVVTLWILKSFQVKLSYWTLTTGLQEKCHTTSFSARRCQVIVLCTTCSVIFSLITERGEFGII